MAPLNKALGIKKIGVMVTLGEVPREANMSAKLHVAAMLLSVTLTVSAGEPTKASQSAYERDILQATTSEGLSLADLAWHAKNTYGWPCEEVIARGKQGAEGYFVITCRNGAKLRVYPRPNQHPRITDMKGTYR